MGFCNWRQCWDQQAQVRGSLRKVLDRQSGVRDSPENNPACKYIDFQGAPWSPLLTYLGFCRVSGAKERETPVPACLVYSLDFDER